MKFAKWAFTPVGANRIKSKFWRRTYWVASYSYMLLMMQPDIKSLRKEFK